MRVHFRSIIYLVVSLVVENTLSAQQFTTVNNAPSSALKYFYKGKKLYQNKFYEKATLQFEKALKKSPNFLDAELQLGSLYFELNDLPNAVHYFNHIVTLHPHFNPKIYYTLSLCQYRLDQYASARKNLEYFLSIDTSRSEIVMKAKSILPTIQFCDSIVKNPNQISEFVPKTINSLFSEYLPTITGDGKTLVFTRRIFNNNEDLFISYLKDSTWTEPESLHSINSPYNEGAPAISPDGKIIIFTSCDRKESLGGCDLYISKYENDSWSLPVNLGEKINSPAFESQPCITDNGNILYFTSNRIGGQGGNDIWFTFRKSDNSWVKPENLGSVINTRGNEECPFVHPNLKFLFFNSDKHIGMGGKDMFVSEVRKDGTWGTPANLGYPLNSRGDENSLIVFPNGAEGMMASDKHYVQSKIKSEQEKKNLDLIHLQFPPELQILPSTWVSIQVFDQESKQALRAKIEIYNLSNQNLVYTGKANSKGEVFISLPTGSDYALHIYQKNYLFQPDQFRCSQLNSRYRPLIISKGLIPEKMKMEKPTILNNLFFETGSAAIKPESYFELDALVEYMIDNALHKIKIVGHTDNIGTDEDNDNLSYQRAKSVVDYLQKKGIDMLRLTYEGKGESEPIASNDTEEGRYINRRTEFIVIYP